MSNRSANLADLMQPGFTIILKFVPEVRTNTEVLESILPAKFQDCRIQPLFCVDALNMLRQRLSELGGEKMLENTRLPAYYHIHSPTTNDAPSLLNWLQNQPEIESAYFPERLIGAPSAESTHLMEINNRISPIVWHQHINTACARQFEGGKGSKASFADIEQGWDLNEAPFKVLPIDGINLNESAAHGRAVLEIVQSPEAGIAPDAHAYLVSQWRPDGYPNAADAILAAIGVLDPGDILLLELQCYWADTGSRLWPIEIQPACFDVIRLASDMGIIVVEAAGNGDASTGKGNDLDDFLRFRKKILDRNSIDFKDSGAVMVAASHNQHPYRRMICSNYSSRIDCFATGDRISAQDGTSEQGHSGMRLRGTSGPAAIIAGAAALVQSIAKANGLNRLDPVTMRAVLADSEYGTASESIGVMPDLERIINHHLQLFPE